MKTQKFRNKKKHGFTLIEILVVVTIIALLVGVFVPLTSRALSNARINSAVAEMRNLTTISGVAMSELGGFLPLTEGITNMDQVSNGLLGGRLAGTTTVNQLFHLNALISLDNVFMSLKKERPMEDYYESPLGLTIQKSRVLPPVRYNTITGDYEVAPLPAGQYFQREGFGDSSSIECALVNPAFQVTIPLDGRSNQVNAAGGVNFLLDGVNSLPAGRCVFMIYENVPMAEAYELSRRLNPPSLLNNQFFTPFSQTRGRVIYIGTTRTTTRVFVYLSNF